MIKKLKNILFLFLLVFAGGCGVWENFTTYFNTYYNAKTLFEETIKAIEEKQTDIFEFKLQPQTGDIASDLTSVIEKSSKILQFHSESDFFDDALLMIGQSFYYQREFSKASRKFNELIALEGSDYNLEARLWEGRTELQLRNFDSGLELLENVREDAMAQEREDILQEVFITRVAFFIYREEYQSAIAAAQELIKVIENEELASTTYFKLGELYTETEETEEAAASFAAVLDHEPSFETEFRAKFENARLQKKLGNLPQSLALLKELRSEDKNEENFNEIELEIGKIYLEQEKYAEAMDQFTYVDTAYNGTKPAGAAAFYRGKIWEDEYSEYDSAYKYYEKAAKSKLPDDLIETARSKKDIFSRYSGLEQDLDEYSRQYIYARNPEQFVEDSLEYEDYLIRDSLRQAAGEGFQTSQTDTVKTDTSKTGKGKISFGTDMVKPVRPKLPADSISTILAKTKFDLGNLFLTEINAPDSAYLYYHEILEEHRDIDFKPRLLFALGTYYDTQDNERKADSMYNIVYTSYRFSSVANEAARKLGREEIVESDPATEKYRMAEETYMDADYNEAIGDFYDIYRNYPESHLAARSLYTIGYILENNLDKPDSAAAVYDTLYSKFSNTDYARTVLPKLGAYKQERKRIQDSVKAEQLRIADSVAAYEKEQQRVADSLKAAGEDGLIEDDGNPVDGIDRVEPGMTDPDSIKPGFQTLPDSLKLIKDDKDTTGENTFFTPDTSSKDTVRYRGPGDTLRIRRHEKDSVMSRRDSLIMEGQILK